MRNSKISARHHHRQRPILGYVETYPASYDIKWSNKPSLSFHHLKWPNLPFARIASKHDQTCIRESMFEHFVALLYWHDFNFLAPKHSAATVSYASYACTFCFSLPTLDLTKRRQKGSKSGIDINFTMKSHVRPQHDSWNEIILEAKGTSHPPSGVANACHVFFTHTHKCGANMHKSRMQIKV